MSIYFSMLLNIFRVFLSDGVCRQVAVSIAAVEVYAPGCGTLPDWPLTGGCSSKS